MQEVTISRSINNVPLVPDYSFVLPFERWVDFETVQSWWEANWTKSIYLSFGYLSAVLIGQVSLLQIVKCNVFSSFFAK